MALQFEHECPNCGTEMFEDLEEEVECPGCHKKYEVEHECSEDPESGPSWYGWIVKEIETKPNQ